MIQPEEKEISSNHHWRRDLRHQLNNGGDETSCPVVFNFIVGVREINIIIHYPQTEEGRKVLKERFDTMYAMAIIMDINKRDLTLEQKKRLLKLIKES